MLVKVRPDAKPVMIPVTVSFSTPAGMSRDAAYTLAPMKFASVRSHLKADGYEWAGYLGHGPRYTQIQFTGPYPHIPGGETGVEGYAPTDTDRVDWKIRALFVHQQQTLTFDTEEVAAADAATLRDLQAQDERE